MRGEIVGVGNEGGGREGRGREGPSWGLGGGGPHGGQGGPHGGERGGPHGRDNPVQSEIVG